MPYNEPEEYRPEPPLRAPITGPMAWEDASLPFLKRLGATLLASFEPLASLHAVANGPLAPAVRFACLTCLPTMLAWAIVPFTQTLLFSQLQIEVIHDRSTLPIWLDVLRAMGIGLALSLSTAFSWSLPFVSLLRAFAGGPFAEDPRTAGWRTMLYRMWVLPTGATLHALLFWAWMGGPSPFVADLAVYALHWLPRVLLLIHCQAMARYFGASGLSAFAITVIPPTLDYVLDTVLLRLLLAFMQPVIQG